VTVPTWFSLISDAFAMPRPIAALMMAGVSAEIVVADQLHRGAEAGGERDPSVVVVLPQPVLDQVHWELGRDADQPVDEIVTAEQFAGHPAAAIGLAELRRSQVQGNAHPVVPGPVPGVGDRPHQQPEYFLRSCPSP
jgi:hypothetical protein